jgi:beta-lactamase class A
MVRDPRPSATSPIAPPNSSPNAKLRHRNGQSAGQSPNPAHSSAPSQMVGQPAGQMPTTARRSADRSPRSRQPHEKRERRPASPFVHLMRLLILGVGIGAIAGTFLSVWNPALNRPASVAQIHTTAANAAETKQSQSLVRSPATLPAGQDLTALTAKIVPLTQGVKDLTPGVFLIDLDSGDYFTLNGASSFSAASMIKVPILIALFQEIDAGRIHLSDKLVLQQTDIGDGSGDMQYSPIGSEYTVLETTTNMITISDNTATNMIVRRLGGIEQVNQHFRQWGLQQTVLHKPLPDLEGTNTTSPKELSTLLSMVSQGEILSMKSRDRALEIMRHTVSDTLLPASLGEGATISHKTGDIGALVGDTGIIDMPNGKRYAITAMVKRPFNDSRAQDLIRQIAATVYEYLNQSAGGQSSATYPSSPSAEPAQGASPIDAAPTNTNSASPDASDPATSDPAASNPAASDSTISGSGATLTQPASPETRR